MYVWQAAEIIEGTLETVSSIGLPGTASLAACVRLIVEAYEQEKEKIKSVEGN